MPLPAVKEHELLPKKKGVGGTVGSIMFSNGYFHSAAESGSTFRLVLSLFGTHILNAIDF